MKFQDLAATVGGILNIALVIGSIISTFFNQINIKVSILNTLFNFDKEVNLNSWYKEEGDKNIQMVNFHQRKTEFLLDFKKNLDKNFSFLINKNQLILNNNNDKIDNKRNVAPGENNNNSKLELMKSTKI